MLLCFLLSAAAELAQAQEPPVVRALRLDPSESIALDGRLDEPVWLRAEPASAFRQSDPQNGEPATEPSEVRIVFSPNALYIGARFFDSEPEELLAYQLLRDGALSADDRFAFTLDPFYDRRSGYFFEINPAGAMADSQLVPAQGRSFGTTENRAWNGVWLARVRRDEQGWTAEIEIPFRTLNFSPDAEAWGINFQRTIRRKNEETFWTGWGRNQGLFSLASEGRLEGLRDLTQGHGLDLKPYMIGTYSGTPGAPGAPAGSSTYKGTGGFDAFYNLTPQLRMDVTVNTDFAQTEVDDRQVNLTRFPLFFPEKRDFFLESAGNFDFSREPADNLTAFFTRRIGLGENGRPQKIDYGVKLAGQAGRFDLGFMQVRTAEDSSVPGGLDGEDFTIFRPRRRLFQQSYVGMIYTRRATRNSEVPDRHTIGADFQLSTSNFRGSQNLRFAGYFIKTPNDAKKGDDAAWGLRLDYPNDLWNGTLIYKEFQTNVDPAIGFIERADFRKLVPGMRFSPRPKDSRVVRQVSMEARAELFTDTAGQWIERIYHWNLMNITFQSGDTAGFRIQPHYERLQSPFTVGDMTLPQGNRYRYTRYIFEFETASRRKVSASGEFVTGSFYSGRRRDVTGSLNLRPRPGLLATLTAEFNRIELAEGSFSAKTLRGVVNTQFSPFVSLSNNVQYDSVSLVLGWQSRFRWIVRPGNDIYFVWLHNWIDAATGFSTLDRNAAAKVIYTYRF